jgi:L-asparaginase
MSFIPRARNTIHVVTTGGTIDKTYDEKGGSLVNKYSVAINRLKNYLRLPYTKIIEHNILAKDSLEITNAERAKIVSYINNLYFDNEFPIVVIHGTDTLSVVSYQVYENFKGQAKKPVIFTGAMRPVGLVDSDAIQNLTEALLLAKTVDPGVYVSFHGHVFLGNKVKKNTTKGTFEDVS